MEIEVTKLMNEPAILPTLSGSVAELGPNAADITWTNAFRFAEANQMVVTDDALLELVDYFLGFGAWDRGELEMLGTIGMNALFVQEVAAEMRGYLAAEEANELQEYQESQGGRLYQDGQGRWWYYVGI